MKNTVTNKSHYCSFANQLLLNLMFQITAVVYIKFFFFKYVQENTALCISPGGPIGPGGPGGPGGPSEPMVGDPGGPRAPGIPGVPGSPGQNQMRKSLSARCTVGFNEFWVACVYISHILHTKVNSNPSHFCTLSHSHICPLERHQISNRTAEYLYFLERHQIQIVQVNQGCQENQDLPLVRGNL